MTKRSSCELNWTDRNPPKKNPFSALVKIFRNAHGNSCWGFSSPGDICIVRCKTEIGGCINIRQHISGLGVASLRFLSSSSYVAFISIFFSFSLDFLLLFGVDWQRGGAGAGSVHLPRFSAPMIAGQANGVGRRSGGSRRAGTTER